MGAKFWSEVLAETLGSIPVFAVGLWLSHHALKRHMTRTTTSQTGTIETLTDAQTAELTGHLDTVTAEQTEQLERGKP